MDEKKRLQAYEKMHREIRLEYDATLSRLKKLKETGKEKTVLFEELLEKKNLFGEIMSQYRHYGFKDD